MLRTEARGRAVGASDAQGQGQGRGQGRGQLSTPTLAQAEAPARAEAEGQRVPLCSEASAAPSPTYREYLPPPELRPYVACYWARWSRASGVAHVLPDGCVDILFDLREGRGRYIGPMTRSLKVAEDGRGCWLGVRFRPGGGFPLLRLPLGESKDMARDLRRVWPDADGWAEQLVCGRTMSERAHLLSEGLKRRLQALSSPAPELRVREGVRLLVHSGGAERVSALSERLGVSRQHLNRLFERHVGLSVKGFGRVVRFQAAVGMLRRGYDDEGAGVAVGAELAAATGFFDQSHLISEFKRLTGLTPSQFVAQERRLGNAVV